MRGRHAKKIPAHVAAATQREHQAFIAWCRKHPWYDPQSDGSLAVYEDRVGFLFIEDNLATSPRHLLVD
jgi:hypothetical protein